MKLETFIILIFTIISSFGYGQTKEIEVNGTLFLFKQIELDTLESAENKVLEVYRNEKKLLTHTIFIEEGDCSSINIQLGNYEIEANKVVFYSYWAATDRMPNSILPFGFRKQIYSVDSLGILKLTEAKIYIENYINSENKMFLEENGWKHKGLKYLNIPVKNEYERRLLKDYITNVENEYNTEFVLGKAKDKLEKKVRDKLKAEIKKYTGNWIGGDEVFGRVKK